MASVFFCELLGEAVSGEEGMLAWFSQLSSAEAHLLKGCPDRGEDKLL